MSIDNTHSSISYSFCIEKNDFVRAGKASSSIKKLLSQIGINSSIIRRAAIATYEAEMNIVIHSSDGGSITVCVCPDNIEIHAEDNGPGIDNVELAMQEGYSTAPDWIREMGFGAGMGLSNMRRCSDYFNIDTKKGMFTKVFIKLTL